MNRSAGIARNEKGVALPLALFVLVALSALVLAFLSMGGMEPQVSRNLSETARARYVADAGVEAAYDQLAGSPLTGAGSWNDILANKRGTLNPGQVIVGQTLPGLAATFGTYSVTMRNDNQAGDTQITGLPLDAGGATNDTNNVVILTAAGTYNGVTRQIQVVLSRLQIPPLPGAVNCGGLQCDFDMGVVSNWTNHHFHAVGLDYAQDPGDPTQMVGVAGNMKYAIAVPTGKQATTGQSFESGMENALNMHQINEMDGQDQTKPPGTAVVSRQYDGAGKNAIAGDATLVSQVDGSGNFVSNSTSKFVSMLQSQSGVNVLMSQKGAGGVTIQNGKPLGANSGLPVNLGTTSKPTVTFFQGDPNNPANPDRVLTLKGTNSGAGILIVSDGILQIYDSFRWDGVIIVTGKNAGVTFDKSVQADVYGAIMLNETRKDKDNPDYELQLQKNCAHSEDAAGCGGNDSYYTKLYSSQQRRDQAQGIRSLVRLTTWREM